ncbi:MAG: adenylate cyclase [Candidatus Aldehydirespiratoraceae bacterium]
MHARSFSVLLLVVSRSLDELAGELVASDLEREPVRPQRLGHHGSVNSEGSSATPADWAASVYRLAGIEAPTIDHGEIAERTGVDPERSRRWWRALGFAEIADDEIAFREADVEVVSQLGSLVDSGAVDDADILRLARLMSTSFSRLVDAQLDVLNLEGNGEVAPMGGQNRLAELADADIDVFGLMEKTMAYVWRRHLLGAIGHRLSVDRTALGQAVAFADLSGFSQLSKSASAEELTRVIETFEAAAFDVVSLHDGRVVKLIGDEAMFVVDTFDVALSAALELIERLAAEEGIPPVHCGIAFGPTVTVGGDVFGTTVNLASRLTSVARGGSVAVPREGAEYLLDREDLDVRKIRRSYDLKGIGRTSILAVRPTTAEAVSAH